MLDQLDTLLTRWNKYLDVELLTVVSLLIGFGLIIMTSASVATSERMFGNESIFMTRQLMFIGLGLVSAILVFQVPMYFWQNLGVTLLPMILILLV
ncbi:MAG: FtsW/RodA/SpoVE family cell cycle protein, partial [Gammaproteobacteria bacterium]|nr:FtsW/RodA/SpoVE family cell cycle protein [Gammaproteobacteria bacterium]